MISHPVHFQPFVTQFASTVENAFRLEFANALQDTKGNGVRPKNKDGMIPLIITRGGQIILRLGYSGQVILGFMLCPKWLIMHKNVPKKQGV